MSSSADEGGRRARGRTGLDRYQVEAVRRFIDEAQKLPAAGHGEWKAPDVGISGGTLKAFDAAGVVEKVERQTNGSPSTWRSVAGVRDYAQTVSERRTTTPCGNATGFTTIEAGEVYTCNDDACDCRFGREVALEVSQ